MLEWDDVLGIDMVGLGVCSRTWYLTAVGLGTSMLVLVKVGVWSGVRTWHGT